MGTALNSIAERERLSAPGRWERWRTEFGCCADMLTMLEPRIVESLLTDYLDAGADIVITNTFQSNRVMLSRYGAETYTAELNAKGVSQARQAISQWRRQTGAADAARQVAGSLGPIVGIDVSCQSAESRKTVTEAYLEQAAALVEAGADMLLFETAIDCEVLALGLEAARRAIDASGRRVEVHVEYALGMDGRLPTGTPLADAMRMASDAGAASVGVNCVFPAARAARYLLDAADATSLPLSLRPSISLGRGSQATSAAEFAEAFATVAATGRLLFAGCCCGGTAARLKALSEYLNHS